MNKIDLVKIVDKIWINEGMPNNVNKVFAITCLQELEEQLILSGVVGSCVDKEKQAYEDGFEHGCTATANEFGSRF